MPDSREKRSTGSDTGEHDNHSLAGVGAEDGDERLLHAGEDAFRDLPEGDRLAFASRTDIARVLRKIANRHIAQLYPTTIAVGLEPRLVAHDSGEVWSLPLIYGSPGYGNHGIVGEVGRIAIDARTGHVVDVTPRDEAVALVRKLHEKNREAIEAAFHSARAT